MLRILIEYSLIKLGFHNDLYYQEFNNALKAFPFDNILHNYENCYCNVSYHTPFKGSCMYFLSYSYSPNVLGIIYTILNPIKDKLPILYNEDISFNTNNFENFNASILDEVQANMQLQQKDVDEISNEITSNLPNFSYTI